MTTDLLALSGIGVGLVVSLAILAWRRRPADAMTWDQFWRSYDD